MVNPQPEEPRKVPEEDSKPQKESRLMKTPIHYIAAILMVLGLIIAFFKVGTGGFLVGIAVGITFSKELYSYFFVNPVYAVEEQGLFKILMLIGALLYFLIAATFFVIGLLIGFGILALIYFLKKR